MFYGCTDGEEYRVSVEEDPAELEKERANYKPIQFLSREETSNNVTGTRTRNRASDRITQELKNMSATELAAQGHRYKQLIEARELEDCLYGG